MKINAIVFLLLLSGLTANCQVAPTSSNFSTSSGASSTSGASKVFASQGCVELGGSLSFTSQSFSSPNGGASSPSTSIFLFAPYVGYFPVQGFELGVDPLSISSENSYGITSTSLLFVFAPSYNIKTNSIAYPFIEGEIGYNSNSESSSVNSSSGMCYGARAGVKLAIATHTLVDIAVQYLVQNYASNGSSEGSINNLVIGVGFTVNL